MSSPIGSVTPGAVVAEPCLDLEWADLSSSRLWKDLSALDAVETAQHIVLRSARNMSREALGRLRDLCPGVRVLDLRSIPQLKAEDLIELREFRHLTALKLGNNPQLGDEAVDGIRQAGSLRFLELVNDTGLSGPSIASLIELEYLESLLLGGASGVDDACVRRLCALDRLQDLRLALCHVTDLGLADIGRCERLAHLNLVGCEQLSDAAVEAIASCRNLVELRMSGCGLLTDGAFRHLSKLRELRAISFSGAVRLSDAGAEALAVLDSIEEVRARDCVGLGDRAALALGSCRRLHVLDATGWAHLSRLGVDAIARLPELRECGLSGLDNRTLEALGNAVNLRALLLSNCPDVTAQGFHSLVGLTSVERFVLGEGTPANVEILQSLTCLEALHEVVIETAGDVCSDRATRSPKIGFPFSILRESPREATVPERLTIMA